MITLITGAPGAGKSAALVDLLSELCKSRAVYVNGIPELQIPHIPLEDLRKWPELVPDGSIVAGDEVQGSWRPLGPGQKVPDDIAALETHRHRGLDFYIITQNPRLLHVNVRALVGRHIHLRDLGWFGRWWYEWPECAENCIHSWKNAPIKKKYRLPKKAFSLYKSASEHIKPIRSFPKMAVVAIAALIGTGYLAWNAFSSVASKTQSVAADTVTGSNPFSPGEYAASNPSLSSAASSHSSAGFIDDRVAFIPRLSSRPETAPAFDQIRQVVNMPLVVGSICSQSQCVCVTQQGTNAGLSDQECRDWMVNPSFDPYTVPVPQEPPRSQEATASLQAKPTPADQL